VRITLLATAIVAAAAIPIFARPADDPPAQYAQAAPMGAEGGERAMGGREGPGMRGWPMPGAMPGMMMHHMMMRRDPQEWCTERLARRAARRAYVQTMLNLTAEQQPLWDKVQSIAQTEAQKERQLCAATKPRAEQTVLDRMDRMQQLLSKRLEALQAAKPAVQALYQALTPEQRATFDRRFRR